MRLIIEHSRTHRRLARTGGALIAALDTAYAHRITILTTPEQLRGRVLSINALLTQGSTPLGGLFLGTLGQVAGVTTAIFVCAMLCLWLFCIAGG